MSILRKRIDALEHTQAQREQELAGRLHAFLSSHTQEQIEHIRQYTPTAQEIEDLRALAQRLEQERAQEQARQIEEIRARNAAYLARPAGRRHAARLMRAAFPYVHLNWEAVFALGTGGRVRSRRKRFHL